MACGHPPHARKHGVWTAAPCPQACRVDDCPVPAHLLKYQPPTCSRYQGWHSQQPMRQLCWTRVDRHQPRNPVAESMASVRAWQA
eukprot:364943-Chlamydomonas_euryale.AAC.3